MSEKMKATVEIKIIERDKNRATLIGVYEDHFTYRSADGTDPFWVRETVDRISEIFNEIEMPKELRYVSNDGVFQGVEKRYIRKDNEWQEIQGVEVAYADQFDNPYAPREVEND